MPLNVGNIEATSGMAKAIYLAIDAELRPPMEEDGVEQENIEQSQKVWKKLSYAIAKGVVTYLKREPASETEYAEAFSSSTEDAEFWDWLSDFVQKLNTWASNPTSNVADLKTSLSNFFSANPPPEELKGVIR